MRYDFSLLPEAKPRGPQSHGLLLYSYQGRLML